MKVETAFRYALAVATAALFTLVVLTAVERSHQTQHKVGAVFGPSTLDTPNWYVDPANASTCASDSNTGTSATCASGSVGPLLHLAEIYRRWGTTSPVISVAITVHVLSNDVATDPWVVTPIGVGDFSNITLIGTPTVLASGTIGTFTPLNRSAATLNKITASGQSGAYWTPYRSQLVHDTTADAYFWVWQDLGSAQASISATMASSPYVATPYKTIANGDAFQVLHLPNLQIGTAGSGSIGWTQFSGFTDIAPATMIQDAQFDKVKVTGFIFPTGGGVGSAIFNNSELDPSAEIIAVLQVYGGLVQGTVVLFGNAAQVSQLDGDCLMTGIIYVQDTLSVGEAAFFDSTYAADSAQPNTVSLCAANYGIPIQWGTAPFDVSNGTQIGICGNATAGLLLTGGYTMDGLTTAYAWNPSTGQYGTAIAFSPANLDTFGALANPERGSRVFLRH